MGGRDGRFAIGILAGGAAPAGNSTGDARFGDVEMLTSADRRRAPQGSALLYISAGGQGEDRTCLYQPHGNDEAVASRSSPLSFLRPGICVSVKMPSWSDVTDGSNSSDSSWSHRPAPTNPHPAIEGRQTLRRAGPSCIGLPVSWQDELGQTRLPLAGQAKKTSCVWLGSADVALDRLTRGSAMVTQNCRLHPNVGSSHLLNASRRSMP